MKPNLKHAAIGALVAIAIMLALAALPSVAADEQGQVQALQAALQREGQCRDLAVLVIQQAQQIEALRREVEAAKPKKDAPK
jgi:hypothetical protein